VLAQADFRFDATILDKRKTQDHLRADPVYFFQEAWYLHAKWIAPRVVQPADELLVVASSLQIKRKKKAAAYAVRDVVSQVSPTARSHVALLAGLERPVPAGGRLRDLGDPAQVRVRRHALLRPDLLEDQERVSAVPRTRKPPLQQPPALRRLTLGELCTHTVHK
jgi:hypothetical protein